jgi:hypothetical protein
MRACVIAVAVIALTQPALAKSHKRHSHHHHHVSHFSHHHHYAARYHRWLRRVPIDARYGMPQIFAYANPVEGRAFGNPSFQSPPWQQAWAAAPQGAPPFGPPARRMRRERVHDGALDSMIARHAAANGLPVELVHRVVTRESGYNPRARSGGNLGLMQIKYATARGVGYAGPASGLMDPETNLTYAVRYLAGAYHAAGGNANRAVALYASGYHGRGAPRAMRVANAPWQMQTPPGWR